MAVIIFLPKWSGTAAAIAALLCLGIALRVANLSSIAGRSPDETVYTKQANTLAQGGTAGLRDLVDEYQRDAVARLFPPPTRIGNLWLLVATMRLSGKSDESAGAYLSCAASIGSLVLLAFFGMRFFPTWATLFALLFFAVSPTELELARRTWGDALMGFLALALVSTTAEVTRAAKRGVLRHAWHLLFVILGGVGILVKESWPILSGFCIVWVLWVLLFERRDWKWALWLSVGMLAATIACLIWLATSVGGFGIVVRIVPNLIHANAANAYALEYQSGPGYLLLQAFWVLVPLAALLCPAGLAVAFVARWKPDRFGLSTGAADWPVIGWTALFLVVFLGIPMLLPHWLNLRYLSPVFGPFYLLAGLGFWGAVTSCWRHLGSAGRKAFAGLVLILVAMSAAGDYRRFQTLFVRHGVGDLSIKLVLDPRHLMDPAPSFPGGTENR